VKARWIVLFAIAVACFIFSKQIPTIVRRMQLLSWQRQCMTFTFGPRQTIVNIATTQPVYGGIAFPWQEFYARLSPPGLRSDGTVFLHELTSPAGHHRLVAVDLYLAFMFKTTVNIAYISRVIVPGTLMSDPKEILPGVYRATFRNLATPARLFAGTTDPTDPSHFSIPFAFRKYTGHIDGWLRDNDQVILEEHFDTATQPVQHLPALSP
jgi:hypothetical protein